jgi:hypothetical protein
MQLADRDPARCQPNGHPLVCTCGMPLQMVPTEDGRDWRCVDEHGRSRVDQAPAELREDPKRWWAELLRTSPGDYSVLSAAATLGYWSWWHPHYPQPCPPDGSHVLLDVPYHCDEPMWLSPNGWRCRACKEALP